MFDPEHPQFHLMIRDVPELVEDELHRVFERWGPQIITRDRWHTIIGEELGEVAKEINDAVVEKREVDNDAYVAELVQVAAMAISAAADALYQADSRATYGEPL